MIYLIILKKLIHILLINLIKIRTLEYLDNLDKYSTKLHSLLKNISNPNTTGKIFIYSSFVDQNAGGGKLIALLLEYLGFQRKYIKKMN